VKQYDVKSAFLNGSLSEEIYMKFPPGSPITDKVLQLNKSLYGLKQAARVWNNTLNQAMLKENFIQSKNDECLYIYKYNNYICYAIVHVNDMIFASNSETLINSKITALHKTFELKCLGNVENYLGIEVSLDNNGVFSISQSKYIQKVASEFG
jgi:Reverse transcriptase (RNA-dependent DNA polymerase)